MKNETFKPTDDILDHVHHSLNTITHDNIFWLL